MIASGCGSTSTSLIVPLMSSGTLFGDGVSSPPSPAGPAAVAPGAAFEAEDPAPDALSPPDPDSSAARRTGDEPCCTVWATSWAISPSPELVLASGKPPLKNTSLPVVNARAPMLSLSASDVDPVCMRTPDRSAPIALPIERCRPPSSAEPPERALSTERAVSSSSAPPSAPMRCTRWIRPVGVIATDGTVAPIERRRIRPDVTLVNGADDAGAPAGERWTPALVDPG